MPASIPLDLARRLTGRNLIGALGAGTFGVTFEANDVQGHHAIKILDPAVQDAKRTTREITALKAVNSQHVVKLLDERTATDAGVSYTLLTCDYLQGPTLQSNMTQYANENSLRGLISEIATGLAALREKRITHRDLKPANIICCQAGAVIIDLGVAKFYGATALTLPGQPVGTFAYMSPEQIKGEDWVDTRSDLFALGIIAYECLLGHHPFATSPDLIQSLLTDNMPPLPATVPWVDALLPKMVAKQAYDRPRTPQALLAVLGTFP